MKAYDAEFIAICYITQLRQWHITQSTKELEGALMNEFLAIETQERNNYYSHNRIPINSSAGEKAAGH